MGFHEKQKQLEQPTSRVTTPQNTSTRAERRSPRARKIRDFAKEMMESSSEDSTSAQKGKQRTRKRRSSDGSKGVISTDSRVEASGAHTSGAAKDLKREGSGMMLKKEDVASASEAERKELKKKRSCDSLHLKPETNTSIKAEVDPMLLDEQSSTIGIFSKEMVSNMVSLLLFDCVMCTNHAPYLDLCLCVRVGN